MKRVGLKEAARLTGLSEWELRTGSKSGKYPSMRVGNPRSGRIIFDIELLEAHIEKLMLDSIKEEDPQNEYGILRKVR